jgi:hypothetical protein
MPVCSTKVKVKVVLRPTVIRPVCLGVKPHLGPKTRFLLQSDSCGFVQAGHSLWREDGSAGPRQRSHSGARVLRYSWPYCNVSDSRLPQPGGPGPRIYIPQEQGGTVIPPSTGFPLPRLLRLAGIRWRYTNQPSRGDPQCSTESKFESYITTDGQSASLYWTKAAVWGLRPDCFYYQRVACLLMWVALSDERTGLSFPTASGPRQRSNFRVRVLWDSWPYFTASGSRLPSSSPPTTRRDTVEVFEPAPTLGSPMLNWLDTVVL